jgi:hypothetical protein
MHGDQLFYNSTLEGIKDNDGKRSDLIFSCCQLQDGEARMSSELFLSRSTIFHRTDSSKVQAAIASNELSLDYQGPFFVENITDFDVGVWFVSSDHETCVSSFSSCRISQDNWI